MDRGGIGIDEFDGALRMSVDVRSTWAKVAYSNAVKSPFYRFGAKALSFDMPAQGDDALGCDVDVRFGLPRVSMCHPRTSNMFPLTSTVSRTLMTPGWRRVRDFLRAFLARGSLDLLAVMSKEKMLQGELSS